MAIDVDSLGYLLPSDTQMLSHNGKPLTGGHVRVYLAGTDTRYITYQDWDGTENPFDILIPNDGRIVVLAENGKTYDYYVYDSYGNLIFSRLNVTPNINGDKGPKGDDGKSAYEVAVDEGYTGTVDEWLASLKGDTGPKGDKGDTGPKGDNGSDATVTAAAVNALTGLTISTSGNAATATIASNTNKLNSYLFSGNNETGNRWYKCANITFSTNLSDTSSRFTGLYKLLDNTLADNNLPFDVVVGWRNSGTLGSTTVRNPVLFVYGQKDMSQFIGFRLCVTSRNETTGLATASLYVQFKAQRYDRVSISHIHTQGGSCTLESGSKLTTLPSADGTNINETWIDDITGNAASADKLGTLQAGYGNLVVKNDTSTLTSDVFRTYSDEPNGNLLIVGRSDLARKSRVRLVQNGFSSHLGPTTLTANRDWILPNASGTLALTSSDITGNAATSTTSKALFLGYVSNSSTANEWVRIAFFRADAYQYRDYVAVFDVAYRVLGGGENTKHGTLSWGVRANNTITAPLRAHCSMDTLTDFSSVIDFKCVGECYENYVYCHLYAKFKRNTPSYYDRINYTLVNRNDINVGDIQFVSDNRSTTEPSSQVNKACNWVDDITGNAATATNCNYSGKSSADTLVVKRTDDQGGAFVRFNPANQETNYWRVGSDKTAGKFVFDYNGGNKAFIETNGNSTFGGSITALNTGGTSNINATGKSGNITLASNENGSQRGIWLDAHGTDTNGKWALVADTNNNVTLNGTATYALNAESRTLLIRVTHRVNTGDTHAWDGSVLSSRGDVFEIVRYNDPSVEAYMDGGRIIINGKSGQSYVFQATPRVSQITDLSKPVAWGSDELYQTLGGSSRSFIVGHQGILDMNGLRFVGTTASGNYNLVIEFVCRC